MICKEILCDVLVIGSAGAGLRAAIAAAEAGMQVVVAAKGRPQRSGATLLAGANVSADLMCDGGTLWKMGIPTADPTDTEEAWYQDLIHEGFYLNERKLVEQYVSNAGRCIRELLDGGVQRTDADEGGRQVCIPGSAILTYLYNRAQSLGVTFLPDTTLCDLLTDGQGAAAGALLLNIPTGELWSVQAGATVLATGGMHNCYSFNSGTSGLCGEGQAAAMRIGAEMTLMEMVTFCPNVILSPQKYRGNILPYIMQCLGYGQLRNGRGEPFLEKYLSPRMVHLALNSEWNKLLLCYAMDREVACGLGDVHGGITFTLKGLTPQERSTLQTTLPQLTKGIYGEILAHHDAHGGLSVFAAGHYFNGGIWIRADMSTSVPGLFAAGECTGGLFGANRVGAATTQMLVQGLQAGQSAAAYARQAGHRAVDQARKEQAVQQVLSPLGREKGMDPRAHKYAVIQAISHSAGVVRTGSGIQDGLKALEELAHQPLILPSQNLCYNRGLLDYLESRSLLACGRAILESSLLRQESRGVFIRQDHLYTDNEKFLARTSYRQGIAVLVPVEQDAIAPSKGRLDYFDGIEQLLGHLSYGKEDAE